MADTDPPLKSLSHHRISFFPFLSLSLSPANTVFLSLFSPCSFSCVFFVSVLYTCAFFISPSPSPSGLCSCDPVPLPLRHSQCCCQGARRRPDRDVRKQIQSATMVISPSHPRRSSQSSDPGQAIVANAVQFCHSRRPRHGQNQHDPRRDLIVAKTHLAIQQFRISDRPKRDPQTQTRPNNHQSIQLQPNLDMSIEHHRENLKPPTTAVCTQHQQLVTETLEHHQNRPNRPQMRTVTGWPSERSLNTSEKSAISCYSKV